MTDDAPPLVADPEAVTAEWLTDVLRHDGAIGEGTSVTSFASSSIGFGQVGENVRYELTYDGPPGPLSVVSKFSSRDPQSAMVGVQTRTYETEVAFYREIAETVDVGRPHCYLAALEPGTAEVVLVLEDLAPATQGDQITGCTVEQAALTIDEAARLHGPRWGDPSLGPIEWLDGSGGHQMFSMFLPPMWQGFVERYRSTLDDVTIDAGTQLVEGFDAMRATVSPAETVVHNDFRLDNLLFHPDPTSARPVAVVDWQTVRRGLGPWDVAYFLGSAFAPEVRRSCEESLVRRYHDALLGYGVAGYSQEQCWDDYRRSSFSCLIMAIFASMAVGRTDRGDAMFMAMANRAAQMAVDLDAYELATS
jgi:hypothetical protein